MTFASVTKTATALACVAIVSGCGWGSRISTDVDTSQLPNEYNPAVDDDGNKRDTIWDLFTNLDDANTTLEVNRYIWLASMDILNFLPVERVDPFSGVIVTGYGTPPGGGRAYRATVYVTDPALDARSLKVSLNTRSGPADPDTVRAVEDAILTRARQMRIQHTRL
ncbi:DUF3576 domain-containing protein [Aliiruegeria sabulilitoris]|uniref:DUF3576 domain-containing protein n=1 Tax=Aliiruegeria sabulilitoris TaxID=1510458 RepID=UPI00082DEE21|nr:DUF3576 domain-containing protein [Aliiruegeria sabulilitoris]NDR58576.1 DUF3576 domain-containing protein [Pseudoruegeria sp. M32A2M]